MDPPPKIAPQPTHRSMCDSQQLIDRVRQSLSRLGYPEIQAEYLGEGRVRLLGRVRSFEERAIMVAAARTVSGVTSVSIKLRV